MKYLAIILILFIVLFPLASQDQRGMKKTDPSIVQQKTLPKSGIVRTGKDYALLFAINEYDSWGKLVNPVFDIETVQKELNEVYGFNCEVVKDPTQKEIMAKLRDYIKRSFNDNDQLLVFFAGHGDFDELSKQGYIVAKDTKLRRDDDERTTFIPYSTIESHLNNMKCNHILLMLDVCFGGTFDRIFAQADRGGNESGEISNIKYIERTMKYKSRKYIASGGKEYVADGRPGNHSPFAKQVLEALRKFGGPGGLLTFSGLMSNYLNKLDKQPRAGGFGNDEPGSDFFFVPRRISTNISSIEIRVTPKDAKIFIDGNWVNRNSIGEGYHAQDIQIGSHIVQVEKDGYRTEQRTVDVGGEPYTANIMLDRAKGTIAITTFPEDAEISIDGSFAGRGSFSGEAPFGSRTIVVTKVGYKSSSRQVLISDQPINVQFKLEPITARLTLQSNPSGAQVNFDGTAKGASPLTIENLAYGEHKAKLFYQEYKVEEVMINVRTDAPIVRIVNLRPTPELKARMSYSSSLSMNRFFKWTSLALAVGTAGGGVYYHSRATTLYDESKNATSQIIAKQKYDDSKTLFNLRNASVGAALVCTALTVYFALTGPDYNEIYQNVKDGESAIGLIQTEMGPRVQVTWRF